MVRTYEQNPFVLPDDQPYYEEDHVDNSVSAQTSFGSSSLREQDELDNDIVLSVQGVSKKFCRSLKRSLFYGIQDIAEELAGSRRENVQLRPKEFWALKDVNLELRRGEAIGLIGANGSGKTTLLRIISGLIKPDAGKIQIRGRIAPLIALGAGFSPILTGRENIYANMSILGLSTQEIDDRFDEVVEFAEIGEAIDAPVQSYSSGMAARLGFACAVHTDPDILLIDEVLAVGDVKFRAKCERRLSELLADGTSFVLVSHFFQGILNICKSAVYLSKGELIASGEARSVMDQYEQDLFSIHADRTLIPFRLPEKTAEESIGTDILAIYFKNSEGEMLESPISGDATYICVQCRVRQKISQLSLFVGIYEPARDNGLALHMSSIYDEEAFAAEPGVYELRVYLPHLGLLPGSYTLNVYVKDGSIYMLDAYEGLRFNVAEQKGLNRGAFYQPRQWQLVEQD
ncbi:MAG: hypothetical protein Kow00121_25040 [Elainellaceae cyanobacterium]